MTQGYWQAKIWGLLHDPALKALHNNTGRGQNSFWQALPPMQTWVENNLDPEKSAKKLLKQLKLADYITSASDRGAIGSLTSSVDYGQKGLEIAHLLSGAKLNLKINCHEQLLSERQNFLANQERQLLAAIPRETKEDIKELFLWLWRCLPEATCKLFNEDASLLLMPAETRLPDASIWSHASITSALAGALGGYDLTPEAITNDWPKGVPLSHAYLASFTFSPIQELIKASRKMRDLWAGSWTLHYLSAKVSWTLANIYGPDCLIYPNLYQQPLIDHWILKQYPRFQDWINQPSDRAIQTAGFPNVIMLVLPKEKVTAAMQTAKSTLIKEWRDMGRLVFDKLGERHWMNALNFEHKTWRGWLESQWQIYWTAVPIGADQELATEQGKTEKVALTSSEIYREDTQEWTEDSAKDQSWRDIQNQAYGLTKSQALFLKAELDFLQAAAQIRRQEQKRNPFNANVGSWWAAIFDQTRFALSAVKNGRDWKIPTAFGTRSTISGLGSVVHPEQEDWVTESRTKKLWKRHAGLFDGIEQLNATETVKRCLHLILPQLLELDTKKFKVTYPDLTAGVAGYLKRGTPEAITYFQQACQGIQKYVEEEQKQTVEITDKDKWGIPWIDEHPRPQIKQGHPRFLNAGWLVEDLKQDSPQETRWAIQKVIDSYYPQNNPANWYILAAGDGDGMSDWLKGNKLKTYQEYLPEQLLQNTGSSETLKKTFEDFIKLRKRMGPSTHNALSRALLDFSNQLVPYLTEERYAGRLIYSGGDDVLAYSNLWEWDEWLWDIRQCFRGQQDPFGEFANNGDYWQWQKSDHPKNLAKRPLFTMGREATISFGIVIAHHSVPLAIALENLWQSEAEAKEHEYSVANKTYKKDAVQVRVMYGNGNVLKATTKFEVFRQWQTLLKLEPVLEPSVFEQAASLWAQHPIPTYQAIAPWTTFFCSRRERLQPANSENFQKFLTNFLQDLWSNTAENELESEVVSWLKLAAFNLRNRQINLPKST